MEIKCMCGKELQLSEVSDEDGDIYNCCDLNCIGQVLIKGNIEVI